MIRTLWLGLLVAIVAADGASAESKTVYGFANIPCAKWQQSRTAKDTGSLQLQAYVDGFLSGYNLASTVPDFLAGAPDDKGESIHIWIDNYCRGKPLGDIMQAMFALKNELLARTR
jgi:hypothetical protein